MSIRIFLVDGHTLVREGVSCLLAGESGMTVVGSADNGRDAVVAVCKLRPDLVICDVLMTQMNGIEATRQIVEFDPSIKVLALSRQCDPQPVSRMIRAGASGYVHKGATFVELVEAIRTVMQGESYLSPAVADGLVRDYLQRVATSDETEPALLTVREREVLQLVSEGYRTKDIADALGLSVKTIETHRKALMVKLGLDSIAELTKYAVRVGLTSLGN
jgi:DNA-binding NarL/FixJ family response regulator